MCNLYRVKTNQDARRKWALSRWPRGNVNDVFINAPLSGIGGEMLFSVIRN